MNNTFDEGELRPEVPNVAALRRQLKHYEEENTHLAEQVIKYRDRCDKLLGLLKQAGTLLCDASEVLTGLKGVE